MIAACLAGDARDWDHLIARYQGLIYTLALRMGMSRSDADDVFQNVCLRLYQHLGDLRDTRRLAAWLISTTRREVWHLRRQGVSTSIEDLTETGAEVEHRVRSESDSRSRWTRC